MDKLNRNSKKHGCHEAARRHVQSIADSAKHVTKRTKKLRALGRLMSGAHGLCSCSCHWVGVHMHCHGICCQFANHSFIGPDLNLNELGSSLVTEPCSQLEREEILEMKKDLMGTSIMSGNRRRQDKLEE